MLTKLKRLLEYCLDLPLISYIMESWQLFTLFDKHKQTLGNLLSFSALIITGSLGSLSISQGFWVWLVCVKSNGSAVNLGIEKIVLLVFQSAIHNASCLSPKILHNYIVFDFSWDNCNTQERLETMVMNGYSMGGGGGGGGKWGLNKVHYGLCENGKYWKTKRPWRRS